MLLPDLPLHPERKRIPAAFLQGCGAPDWIFSRLLLFGIRESEFKRRPRRANSSRRFVRTSQTRATFWPSYTLKASHQGSIPQSVELRPRGQIYSFVPISELKGHSLLRTK